MNQQSKRDHWAHILEQQKDSNSSIKQFCSDNEFSYQTFYYWSKEAQRIRSDKKNSAYYPDRTNTSAVEYRGVDIK